MAKRKQPTGSGGEKDIMLGGKRKSGTEHENFGPEKGLHVSQDKRRKGHTGKQSRREENLSRKEKGLHPQVEGKRRDHQQVEERARENPRKKRGSGVEQTKGEKGNNALRGRAPITQKKKRKGRTGLGKKNRGERGGKRPRRTGKSGQSRQRRFLSTWERRREGKKRGRKRKGALNLK